MSAISTSTNNEPPFPYIINNDHNASGLSDWLQSNASQVNDLLFHHGAILFRGFAMGQVEKFEKASDQLCTELFVENGEHVPESDSEKVATPVFYPPEENLMWHNENSFNREWPLKIIFCCAKRPDQGGETTIVDSRQVYRQIDPKIRERFIDKQVMYVRNYTPNMGVDWKTIFRVTTKTEAEAYCRKNKMEYEWKGNHLMTRSRRPAVVEHPVTKEISWFNQALHWHPRCLKPEVREALALMLKPEDFPRQFYYGDGSVIEDSIIDAIIGLYRELEVAPPWQVGNLMLVDNVLAAHGRNAYQGQRKLLVAMGEMYAYE